MAWQVSYFMIIRFDYLAMLIVGYSIVVFNHLI